MPTLHKLLVLLALTLTVGVMGGETKPPISKSGCSDSCGNMSIPYPFGIGEQHCSLSPVFLLDCNATSNTCFRNGSFLPWTEIMLLSGEVRIWLLTDHICYDSNGDKTPETYLLAGFRSASTYTLSHSKNKFTVVGCDATAYVQDTEGKFRTGCSTGCQHLQDVVNGSCDGIGCCQISVPRRIRTLDINLDDYGIHDNETFNPCNSAFVVEQAAYNFTSLDFTLPTEQPMKPAIFDWAIGDANCSFEQNQQGYVCGNNTVCLDYDNGPGYRCNCSDGYRGNPYLPDGCIDINECMTLDQPCNVTCTNTPGNYTCSPCLKGYEGDGRNDGKGCVRITSSPYDKSALTIGLGISLSISALLLAGAWLYWGLQKRKLIQLRKKHFKENGGTTLQQLLSEHDSQIVAFKIFTAQELHKATHNYEESRVLGQGGQGTVYKGELPDKTIVAIKRSNAIDKNQVHQFINEIVVLSRIDHKNVVKILGCCLETEVPMLVYEFIAYGTLYDHIQRDRAPKISWRTRLRIAAETAGAISYLHSSASIPIIHRDIKTTNILLDKSYTAKVSDFGTSKFSPVDKKAMTTLVQGTLGYLDPEYFLSSQLTEKSDVYSFGVVLVELLTGAKVLNFERKEEERSLAMYFLLYMNEDRLFEIIDDNVKRQANGEHVMDVAAIAAKCLNLRGEDRPSMKEVATELEKLAQMEMMHPWLQNDVNLEEESELLIRGSIPSEANPLQIDGIAIGR